MRYLALLAFVILSTPAQAETQLQLALKDQKSLGLYSRNTCVHLAGRAGAVMLARQFGKSPSALINEAKDEDRTFIEALVFMAYDEPRYSSSSGRDWAVTNMENDVEIACLQVFFPS